MRIARAVIASILGVGLSIGVYWLFGWASDWISTFNPFLWFISWVALLSVLTLLCAIPSGIAYGIVHDDGNGEESDARFPGSAVVITAVALAVHAFNTDPIGARWPIWVGLLVMGVVIFMSGQEK
jgi:hypothetical protein